jgi:hypothetical protein
MAAAMQDAPPVTKVVLVFAWFMRASTRGTAAVERTLRAAQGSDYSGASSISARFKVRMRASW